MGKGRPQVACDLAELTKADKVAAPAPDLLRREFIAEIPDRKWCGARAPRGSRTVR